jgi:hypothetical protein
MMPVDSIIDQIENKNKPIPRIITPPARRSLETYLHELWRLIESGNWEGRARQNFANGQIMMIN